MKNDAISAFMANTETARELLRMISADVNDHMHTHPDAITWAHVGDSAHVVESLRDIARFMGHVE